MEFPTEYLVLNERQKSDTNEFEEAIALAIRRIGDGEATECYVYQLIAINKRPSADEQAN